MHDWQLQDLVDLVRLRYPDWDSFTHPTFEEEEVTYKHAAVSKMADLLNENTFMELLKAWQYDDIIKRVEKVAQATNLLWLRQPKRGDLRLLYEPNLDKAEFCLQLQALLFGKNPTPARLDEFAQYAGQQGLPDSWPLPTYLLFLSRPDTNYFVKPQATTWFLKFMGVAHTVVRPINATTYQNIQEQLRLLRNALLPYGVRDMIDLQSFIWVAYSENKNRMGTLNKKAQVELDIPPLNDQTLHEPTMSYTLPSTLYSLQDCSDDTGYPLDTLQRWTRAIQRKQQAIFYGPPGTGKTYLAEHLAKHLVGGGDGFIERLQFHPAYAYEDFIQGLRPQPAPDGSIIYELVPGRFLTFCHRAKQHHDTCILIIDEINRANLARVFGELMYLLEYRDQTVPLAGGGELAIPANVVILGTMNTADRSIALVDHALRRRFAFIPLQPNADILRHYHRADPDFIEKLIPHWQRLNAHLDDPNHAIGHTFFMQSDLPYHLPDIWQMEIEPYLEEYFFGHPEQVEPFRWDQIKTDILE